MVHDDRALILGKLEVFNVIEFQSSQDSAFRWVPQVILELQNDSPAIFMGLGDDVAVILTSLRIVASDAVFVRLLPLQIWLAVQDFEVSRSDDKNTFIVRILLDGTKVDSFPGILVPSIF